MNAIETRLMWNGAGWYAFLSACTYGGTFYYLERVSTDRASQPDLGLSGYVAPVWLDSEAQAAQLSAPTH